MHDHRPAPWVPIGFGVVLLLAISVPGLIGGASLASIVMFAFCLLLVGGLVALGLQHVECKRDGEQLTLRHVRWPLATAERSIPLARIARVDVRARQRGARHVVLVLDDGSEIFFPGGASRSSAHEATAEVLRSWRTR